MDKGGWGVGVGIGRAIGRRGGWNNERKGIMSERD